uniref:Uncharacterized protein n=1 Tax=Anguilla anguilla TaxID=7936 RepID=A0A0E9T4S9_ANGAN
MPIGKREIGTSRKHCHKSALYIHY